MLEFENTCCLFSSSEQFKMAKQLVINFGLFLALLTSCSSYSSSDKMYRSLSCWKLKLKFYYDSSFLVLNEGLDWKVKKRIVELVKHLQQIFDLPSFNQCLKLDLDPKLEPKLGHDWQASSNTWLDKLGLLVSRKENEQLHIFLTLHNVDFLGKKKHYSFKNNHPVSYGLSFINSICHPNPSKRLVILEWNQSDEFSARILAHEIGHTLGIRHDFMDSNREQPRFDSFNQSCSKIGMI